MHYNNNCHWLSIEWISTTILLYCTYILLYCIATMDFNVVSNNLEVVRKKSCYYLFVGPTPCMLLMYLFSWNLYILFKKNLRSVMKNRSNAWSILLSVLVIFIFCKQYGQNVYIYIWLLPTCTRSYYIKLTACRRRKSLQWLL